MNHDLDYLSCSLPEDIERVITFGNLAEAMRLIGLRLEDKAVIKALKRRLSYEPGLGRILHCPIWVALCVRLIL